MVTLDQFREMLSRHDWYYYMSDDPRAYREGASSARAIRIALMELHTGPDGFAAQKMFDSTAAEYTL